MVLSKAWFCPFHSHASTLFIVFILVTRVWLCGGQVEAALGWLRGKPGEVRIIGKGDGDGSDLVLATLPPATTQALLAVSDAGDLSIVVGLRGSRVESGEGDANRGQVADKNMAMWLGRLANMPLA